MGYIDLILIVIIVVIGLRGFYNGLVNELAGVIGIVFGVFLASRFSERMGEWFSGSVYNFNSPSVSALIGFVIILAVVWIICLIIGVLISKMIKISDFVIIDKTLGFIFSCCKIFLIIGFILYVASYPVFMKNFVTYMNTHSKIYNITNVISENIMKIPGFQNALNRALEPTKQDLKQVGKTILDEGSRQLNNAIEDKLKDSIDNKEPSSTESSQ